MNQERFFKDTKHPTSHAIIWASYAYTVFLATLWVAMRFLRGIA